MIGKYGNTLGVRNHIFALNSEALLTLIHISRSKSNTTLRWIPLDFPLCGPLNMSDKSFLSFFGLNRNDVAELLSTESRNATASTACDPSTTVLYLLRHIWWHSVALIMPLDANLSCDLLRRNKTGNIVSITNCISVSVTFMLVLFWWAWASHIYGWMKAWSNELLHNTVKRQNKGRFLSALFGKTVPYFGDYFFSGIRTFCQ